MRSLIFFLFFIPVLSFILLVVNLILAPHNPYGEKKTAFECGFHSFLDQNRTQFNISFFIFALLFLLFDLEILLVYPYAVSSYINNIYGLIVMLIFLILLTLGFVFELGKNALSISSRQYNTDLKDKKVIYANFNILNYIVSKLKESISNLNPVIMRFKFMIKGVFTGFINFFTLRNILKIFIIFIFGFLGRIFMVEYFDIDVFYNYVSFYSILFYFHMSVFSIWLSEYFTTIPNLDIGNIIKGINNLIKGMKSIIISIYDKYHMILGGSPVDTKPFKEIKSIDRKYVHAMDTSKDSAGGSSADGNGNSENNLGESSKSKGKGKAKEVESGMEPLDPNVVKLIKIIEDLDYKDSIINDKKINNTDKLKRLELSDTDPEKSDSTGDAKRVGEIKSVLDLKRKTLESDMDLKVKLDILERLSLSISKVYEEKGNSKLPTRNLEQNPLISSQSHPDLSKPAGIPPRSITASNLNTGTEEVFSSPPRAPHREIPFKVPEVSSPKAPHGGTPHGEMSAVPERKELSSGVSKVSELPSVVMDMESGTPSKSVNRDDEQIYKFVHQDNQLLSDKDSSDKESSLKSKFKNFFKKKK